MYGFLENRKIPGVTMAEVCFEKPALIEVAPGRYQLKEHTFTRANLINFSIFFIDRR